MNYTAAISDFFKTPHWPRNMLFGAICVFLPFVGQIVVTGWMVIGFWGRDDELASAREAVARPLDASAADELGLVTVALDDIDFEDEVRIALEERASLSPDALSGLEANHRFVGPETLESKIFGRLSVWQNWIFLRPNASGPDGALRRYGSGQRGSFDHHRV